MEQSERTSRETQRPVDRGGPRVVVVGVDETVTALRAASYAAGIARRSRARLIIVHVKRPVVPIWGVLGVWGPADVEPRRSRSFSGKPSSSSKGPGTTSTRNCGSATRSASSAGSPTTATPTW